MTVSVHDAILKRVSVGRFQPGRPLEDEVIARLVNLATRAPSAFNMQNWRLIAVRSPEGKEQLREAAFGQQKITDASVDFIVCGSLAAHRLLSDVLQPSITAGIMTQSVADAWSDQATGSYENNPDLQRYEAVRSASLAAMTLMLAAQGVNLGSCPMTGFDALKVSNAFGLSDQELPVMIVAVGYPVEDGLAQKVRRQINEVLSFA